MLCVKCRHGHDCPYFSDAEDMFHALLYVAQEIDAEAYDGLCRRAAEKDPAVFEELEQLVIRHYSPRLDFELGYDPDSQPHIGLKRCSGYEEAPI